METVTITVTDVNDNTPEFDDDDGDGDSATAAASVAENSQSVGTYGATDADSTADLTYSVVDDSGGAGNSVDHDLFTVDEDTGALTFTNAPNYEAPGCGAGNNANTCVVILQVSDGANTDTITVTVTVTDVDIAITSNSASLAEDAGNGDAVLTMASTGDGADANGWSITDGNTGTAFAIDSTSGAITVADSTQIDRETLASYTLEISISDGTGDAITEDVVITITDVNDNSPAFSDGDAASASVDENTQTVGTYAATDADSGDTITYSVSGGTDSDLFTVNLSLIHI